MLSFSVLRVGAFAMRWMLLSLCLFDRIKIAQKMVSDRVGGNTSNVSVLLPEYGELCTQAINEPQQRFEYWNSKLKERSP